jgi:hypothetical protein
MFIETKLDVTENQSVPAIFRDFSGPKERERSVSKHGIINFINAIGDDFFVGTGHDKSQRLAPTPVDGVTADGYRMLSGFIHKKSVVAVAHNPG